MKFFKQHGSHSFFFVISLCLRAFVAFLFLFSFLIIPHLSLCQQSKKELERKKEKLQKEIEATNKQLQQMAKSKIRSQAEVDVLNKKISARQDLILTIDSEIGTLGTEISETGREITSLEHNIEDLKKEYAEMIRFAYKNRDRYRQLMFVFAATDFNQAYQRLKYFQQYNEYMKKQAEKMESSQRQLSEKKSALEEQKKDKTKLKTSHEREKKNLDADKKEQLTLISNIQVSEKKLKKQLNDKLIAKKKLDRAIENIIRRELEAAKKKAAAAGNKNVTASNAFMLTPEAQKLSSSFASNRGSLPWPVEQGTISEYFGEHPHPQLKGVIIKNNGIDIAAPKGSAARTIFNGEVSGVVSIPGANEAVIIRHGEYLSVYSNLESVGVKKGDKVTTKQKIGTTGNDDSEGKAELHLEIWKGTTKLNPAQWLAGK